MKLKRHSKFLLLLLLVLGVGALAISFFSAFLKKNKTFPPEKIVTAERASLARSVVAIGKIESLSRVEVKSKANGIIKLLLVNVGDKVKTGQILAELDKENLEARVREARAQLEGTEANLQSATTEEARARIEAVNPDLEFVRREYERNKRLFSKGVVSEQQVEDSHKLYEIAVNRRDLLDSGINNAAAQVRQARARVAEARAALDRAEDDLRNATVVAPIDGVVLTRDKEVGDAVSSILNLGSAATLIMTLGDTSTVYVKGNVDESDVGKISLGMTARTTVESFPGETFQGTVTNIAPMGLEKDNVTTFEARVSISNPQGKLRVNMSANAEIILEERENILVISEGAIIYDRDRNAYAQILDPSVPEGLRKVPVRIGISNGQKREVIEGLKEGDEVVLP